MRSSCTSSPARDAEGRLAGPRGPAAAARTEMNSFIPPAEFIPVAEEMGFIGKIGAWVVREACRNAANWPDHLGRREPFAGAVRIGNVCDMVTAALAETGPARIAAGTRDHRKSAVPRHGRGADGTSQPEGAGRCHRDGRFRHRLFEPELPLALPFRQDQDRPQLHARLRYRRQECQNDFEDDRRARPFAENARDRRRGGNLTPRGFLHAPFSATRCKASISAGRCR